MSQRLLSCPSAFITKGAALKAGDLSLGQSKEPSEHANSANTSRTPSFVSLQNGFKATPNSSSSSLSKHQFDWRVSSSSLNSVKTVNSSKSCPASATTNATWDEVGVAATQADGTRRLSLFDLAGLKASNVSSENKAPRHSSRNCASKSSLASLNEENEFLRRSFLSALKNDAWDEMNEDSKMEDVLAASLQNILMKNKGHGNVYCDEVMSTFTEKPSKQVDTKQMTLSDLSALKKADSFMYFSIPAVKEAEMHGAQIDLPTLHASENSTCKRKSCISFESCYVIGADDMDSDDLPHLVDGFFEINMNSEDEDSQDDLYAYLEQMST